MFQGESFICGEWDTAQPCHAHPHPGQPALLLSDLQGLLLPDLLGQLPNQSPVLVELEL